MVDYNKVKSNPELKEKYNNYIREYLKNKYDNDPEYREYMREKARKRKAMLREAKQEKKN